MSDDWKLLSSAPKDGRLIEIWAGPVRQHAWWSAGEGIWLSQLADHHEAQPTQIAFTHWRPAQPAPRTQRKDL